MPQPSLSQKSLEAHRVSKAPPTRVLFDPWNSAARGHQIPEANPGQAPGWRESRDTKLRAQLSGGVCGDGGERMYDLVGGGARDEGLEYAARKAGVARGRCGEVWNDVEALISGDVDRARRTSGTKQKDKILRALRAMEKEAVHEEEICQVAAGRKRAWEEMVGGGLQVDELVALAEDSEDIWDPTLREELEHHDSSQDVERSGHDPVLARHDNRYDMRLALDDDEAWDADFSTQPAENHEIHAMKHSASLPLKPTVLNSPPLPESPPKTPTPPRALPPPSAPLSLTALLVLQPKPIFRALTIHISGTTMPHISDHALRALLSSHGAEVTTQLAKRRVTHVIVGAVGTGEPSVASAPLPERPGGVVASRLRQAEVRRVRTAGGKGARYVHVRWVLESVRAGRRLAENRFAVGEEREDAGATASLTASQSARSGPLTAAERAAIEAPVREEGWGRKARGRKKDGKPGVPAGQKSVKSMFVHQARKQVWSRAGFEKKARLR